MIHLLLSSLDRSYVVFVLQSILADVTLTSKIWNMYYTQWVGRIIVTLNFSIEDIEFVIFWSIFLIFGQEIDRYYIFKNFVLFHFCLLSFRFWHFLVIYQTFFSRKFINVRLPLNWQFFQIELVLQYISADVTFTIIMWMMYYCTQSVGRIFVTF